VQPNLRTRKMAGRALEYLQFFDALSLWLCGAARQQPETFTSPEGYELSLIPQGLLRFTAEPWPLTVGSWSYTVTARRMPVGTYRSQAELAAAPHEPVELTFQLST
jgi:hypothetical protein